MDDSASPPGAVPPPLFPVAKPATPPASAPAPVAPVAKPETPPAPAPAPAAAAPVALPEALPGELPYPMAKRLREQGVKDDDILTALERTGMTKADALFVINSLPGGQFSQSSTALSSDTNNAGSAGLPITGLAMVGLGVLITVGSYAGAAPGGTYVVTWGLILAGIVRIMRGR